MARRAIKGNQPGHVPANKGRTLPPEPLTAGEVGKLIGACSPTSATGIRHRALIVMLWRGQLRVSEALALQVKDLDTSAGSVRVLHGKGDKSRLVGLDPEALAVVQRWLDRRKQLGLNGRHPLFATHDGKPIAAAYIRALLPRLARRAGIEKRVHAHGLRHTGAAELANEGAPIHVISAQLGHSNVATTSRYIAHLQPQVVVDAMKARTWNLPKA